MKLITKKTTLVRYMGYRSTVSRNSLMGQPYRFMREKWIEVHANDIDFYVIKSKVDDSWEVKLSDKKVMETYYFAKWLSNTAKQRLTMAITDKDNNGNEITGSLRNYIFNNRIWVLIDKRDIGKFKIKAEGNTHWKFEKAYLQKGIDVPMTSGGLSVQEHFNKLMKVVDEAPKQKANVQEQFTAMMEEIDEKHKVVEDIVIEEISLTKESIKYKDNISISAEEPIVELTDEVETITEEVKEEKKPSKKVVKKKATKETKSKENDK